MAGYALVELGLTPFEFRKLTLSEVKKMLTLQREKAKQEYIHRAELVTIIVNACGMNLKRGIEVKDILGFDPYKAEPKEKLSKTDLEDEMHILKQKLGGESSGS